MAKQDYFRQALSAFTFDMACGSAIRYLADQGYTVRQIVERLDFPAPFEKVQRAVWDQLLSNGTLLTEEPGAQADQPRYDFVKEYDANGRPSFRRVLVKPSGSNTTSQRTATPDTPSTMSFTDDQQLRIFLIERCARNGIPASYASLDFGLQMKQDPEGFAQLLQSLNPRQRDYIRDLPWERRRVYHRLDSRMQEILIRLYGRGLYNGTCYFLNDSAKIQLFPQA